MAEARPSWVRPAIGLFFLLSGFAALAYQIAWQRVLTQVIGSDFVSVTIVVAIFMIGLGLGSYVSGELLPRLRSRVSVVYGAIEVFIGLYGLGSIPLLRAANAAFAGPGGGIAPDALLNFALLAPPILAMGMTTPLIVHLSSRTIEGLGRSVGVFYGLNILGAALGALVTGLVLIEMLGLRGVTIVAASINIGIGLVFLVIARSWRTAPPSADRPGSAPATWTLAALAFGFGTLALQMIFFRVLTNYFTMSTVVFPAVLCAFLILMAAGQAIGGWLADQFPTKLTSVIVGLAVAGAALLAGALWFPPPFAATIGAFRFTTFSGALIRAEHPEWIGDPSIASVLVFSFLFMLAVAPWSALFPVLLRMATQSVSQAGVRFAGLYFVYTIGNLAGSLIGGAVLLAMVGTIMSAKIVIACVIAAALALTLTSDAKKALAASGVALILALTLPSDYYKRFGVDAYQVSEVLEGRNGVATIVPTQRFYTIVDMNRTASASAMARDPAPDAAYQAWRWNHTDLFALDPGFRPKRVLMIGIGHGYLAQTLLDFDFIEEITIVDLSDEVVEAVRRSTQTDARAIFTDPRVRIVIGDGRRFVQAALARGERYDLIQTKVNEPWHAGSGNLFTVEFMRLQQRLLTPGGYLSVRPLAGHLVDGLAVFPLALIAGNAGEFYHVYFRNGPMAPPTRALVTADIAAAWKRELPGRDVRVSYRADTLPFAYFSSDPFGGTVSHNTDDRPMFEYYWLRQKLGKWDDPRRPILNAAPFELERSVPVVYEDASTRGAP